MKKSQLFFINKGYLAFYKRELEHKDYLYLLILATTVNEYGKVDHLYLENFVCETQRYKKIKNFKNIGVVKKLKLFGKSEYFIDPNFCRHEDQDFLELFTYFN